MELVVCELGYKLTSYEIHGLPDFSGCDADLLQAHQTPSPSSRLLVMHLALEGDLQISGVRPESKTPLFWATVKFSLFILILVSSLHFFSTTFIRKCLE